jgi:adenylate kinase
VTARLVVLGRQGAGKGTQCSRLAELLGIRHVSTGDLFRAEIGTGSSLGRAVARYVAAGELVPDEVVLDVVASNLGAAPARAQGYLLDGFPRTLAQGQALFEVLGAGAVDLALELEVPVDVVVGRLAARRVCQVCAAVTTGGGAEQGGCESCGGPLERRADDHPEAIERRLALYDQQSGPLLVWLDALGLLETVDGLGDADIVHERILTTVARRVPAARTPAG